SSPVGAESGLAGSILWWDNIIHVSRHSRIAEQPTLGTGFKGPGDENAGSGGASSTGAGTPDSANQDASQTDDINVFIKITPTDSGLNVVVVKKFIDYGGIAIKKPFAAYPLPAGLEILVGEVQSLKETNLHLSIVAGRRHFFICQILLMASIQSIRLYDVEIKRFGSCLSLL
ncbi:hypothetical protein BV898_20316, partial [Hypsibius exemplaris]